MFDKHREMAAGIVFVMKWALAGGLLGYGAASVAGYLFPEPEHQQIERDSGGKQIARRHRRARHCFAGIFHIGVGIYALTCAHVSNNPNLRLVKNQLVNFDAEGWCETLRPLFSEWQRSLL